MGMMRAREGASMKCTNLVSSSVCRHDLGVADDRADEAEGLLAGLLHLHMGGHQKRGKDQLHSVGAQVPHHSLCTVICSLFKFFLSWMPSVSVAMISCCLSARIPRPLTRPASPYAAPFLSAYLSLSSSSCSRFLTIPAESSLMAGTKGGKQLATDSWT
ncbi:hypothetical protein EYF80_012229 [Liparis tanakae]|uniref:Uncharacterized protein n=1 Tax=Liparis tanakae TaxID=230148 RepID=A0A4Z2IHZ9_9TELE|nr:hypothetical protein EYF80_012229 [Liparis tanakae]